MSLENLKNIFTNSDKFTQIVESKRTDVKEGISHKTLSTPTTTPTKMAEQLKVSDNFSNDRVQGFTPNLNKNPETQFKFEKLDKTYGTTIKIDPISQKTYNGIFGSNTLEKSNVGVTKFKLNIFKGSNLSESNLGIGGIFGEGLAVNTLIDARTIFNTKQDVFASTRFGPSVIDKTKFSIINSGFKNTEVIFNTPDLGALNQSDVLNQVEITGAPIFNQPEKKKKSTKDKIKDELYKKGKKKVTSYLDKTKEDFMESSTFGKLTGTAEKLKTKSIEALVDFGNSDTFNKINAKAGGRLSTILDVGTNNITGFDIRAAAKAGIQNLEQKLPQKNITTEDFIPYHTGEEGSNHQLRFHAWDEFYNSDHTNKGGYHYGANVNLANRNIRYQGYEGILESSFISRTSDITGGALASILGDNFHVKEPYLVHKIPSASGEAKGSAEEIKDLFMRGISQFSPIKNALQDVERLGKFLSSPAGLLFIGRQELLGMTTRVLHTQMDEFGNRRLIRGRQRFNAFYDPFIGTLASAGTRLIGQGQNMLFTRSGPTLSDEKVSHYVGGFPTAKGGGKPSIPITETIEDSFTGGTPLAAFSNTRALELKVAELISEELVGPGQVGIVKSKSSGGDRMTLAGLASGTDLSTAFQQIQQYTTAEVFESERNGLPFYFIDLRTDPPTYLIFRAYLDGITESISPTWNSKSYIGRSDQVYNYSNTERSINFNLKLFAHTADELKAIYIKLNHLTSLCYPEYMQDTLIENFGKLRPKPPITKIRIGEWMGSRDNEVVGFIKSLEYSINDDSPWETKPGKRVPKSLSVTVGYQVLHSTSPSLQFAQNWSPEYFYGINSLSDPTIAPPDTPVPNPNNVQIDGNVDPNIGFGLNSSWDTNPYNPNYNPYNGVNFNNSYNSNDYQFNVSTNGDMQGNQDW